ncbi:hypothetical protein BJY21_003393 [Kineosphaera limosa]|uniref:Bulb-type lectin domain-containing protein n=1 Tax=Kineosphaera limosa NBRC 100340 TaxID=1184609 RepID=K6VCW9_9MICO|nr:hypothetical protein [Kineosphaera limosa]NYE02209.1 hypothetical protein [Kineosphaera limosa]GAB94063.1 hypothetical protein KILIM_002_00200 [Kineosphaera limosa NBRC 100340]
MHIIKKAGLATAALALCLAPLTSGAQTSHAASTAQPSQTAAISNHPTRIVPPNKKDCRRYITWTASKGEYWLPGRMCLVSTAKYSSWLVFQEDGNLVHYGGDPLRAMWSSNTHNKGASRLAFQKDGNVVIYRGTRALWSTNTWEKNRPRKERFSFGIPDRDGTIDSATVVLIENPVMRGGRPTFQGRLLWRSYPR